MHSASALLQNLMNGAFLKHDDANTLEPLPAQPVNKRRLLGAVCSEARYKKRTMDEVDLQYPCGIKTIVHLALQQG